MQIDRPTEESRKSKTKDILENMSFILELATIPFRLMWPSSGHGGQQDKLGIQFSDRYRTSGNLADLQAAIRHQQAAVDATPAWHPYLLDRLQSLAVCLSDRYQRLGDINDLEDAIKYQQVAIKTLPRGHRDLPVYQRNLAVSFLDRFRRVGQLTDLEAAIECDQAAVDAIPKGHPDLPGYQQSLAVSYMDRYQRLGNLDDLETAIRYNFAALHAISLGHHDWPTCQLGLGMAFTRRYRRKGDINDLKAALKHKKAAVDATPCDHHDMPTMQQSLAASYADLYHREGDLANLEKAMSYNKASIQGTPEGHPSLPFQHENLAISYMDLYHLLGNLADLESAIKYSLSAIGNIPPGHPSLPGCQQSMASAYRRRYIRLGNLDDLESALKYNTLAVENTPLGHPALPGYQRDLASAYSDRYERLHQLDDLKSAFRYDKASVEATSQDDTEFPGHLHNLAMSYKALYRRGGGAKYLEAAIKCERTVIELTPSHHPNLSGRHQNLAGTYIEQYKRFGNMTDLEAALVHGKAAVDNTQEGLPEIVLHHQGLSILYDLYYSATGDLEDLALCMHYAELSSTSISAPPVSQWNAAINWADLAVKHNKRDSVKAYIAAFNVLPDLVWIGSSLSLRHDILLRYGIPGATSSAVAVALSFNQLHQAVEFLEQGLAITHRQLLELKEPANAIMQHYPIDAQRLQEISFQLSGSAGNSRTLSESDVPVNYNLLAVERNNLIGKIRRYKGFEDFLKPASFSKLYHAAEKGPVIMLNCATTRSDAIVIMPAKLVQSVQLVGVSPITIKQQLGKLQSALKGSNVHTRNTDVDRAGRPANHVTPQEIFRVVLLWLWRSVVQPVFCLLKENGIDCGRIWWCPSGPFTYLPIHAAAPVCSKFIQSYTFTLEALIQARHKASGKVVGSSNKATLIGVTKIPNQTYWSDLPSVKKEIDTVAAALSNYKPCKLVDSKATISNVLKELESTAWLHLACHGQQDPHDPLKSSLMLFDGRLELRRILNTNLPAAKFVYLSACETAMGDAELMNEAMHLAGGFIAAGFQGAIGTLWSMSDADGPKISDTVYKGIFRDGHDPDVTNAAEGLHTAVQKLRKQDSPYHHWIPFIHVGI